MEVIVSLYSFSVVGKAIREERVRIPFKSLSEFNAYHGNRGILCDNERGLCFTSPTGNQFISLASRRDPDGRIPYAD